MRIPTGGIYTLRDKTMRGLEAVVIDPNVQFSVFDGKPYVMAKLRTQTSGLHGQVFQLALDDMGTLIGIEPTLTRPYTVLKDKQSELCKLLHCAEKLIVYERDNGRDIQDLVKTTRYLAVDIKLLELKMKGIADG